MKTLKLILTVIGLKIMECLLLCAGLGLAYKLFNLLQPFVIANDRIIENIFSVAALLCVLVGGLLVLFLIYVALHDFILLNIKWAKKLLKMED